MTWKVDVQLSQSVIGAADRARELEAMGVDGVFTFENSHDLFFPLVAAAPVCDLDLMTNVAIAFPRSPMVTASVATVAASVAFLAISRIEAVISSAAVATVWMDADTFTAY